MYNRYWIVIGMSCNSLTNFVNKIKTLFNIQTMWIISIHIFSFHLIDLICYKAGWFDHVSENIFITYFYVMNLQESKWMIFTKHFFSLLIIDDYHMEATTEIVYVFSHFKNM